MFRLGRLFDYLLSDSRKSEPAPPFVSHPGGHAIRAQVDPGERLGGWQKNVAPPKPGSHPKGLPPRPPSRVEVVIKDERDLDRLGEFRRGDLDDDAA